MKRIERQLKPTAKANVLDKYGKCAILETQGHYLQLKIPCTVVKAEGITRGVISEFSNQSRKRMLETLARLDTEKLGFICFVTLTYPDLQGPPTPQQTDRDRQTFLKRIKRFCGTSSGIWRREWEARKSGEFVGVEYPHYHFLFFGLPFMPHQEINTIWAEVIGYDGYIRTEIEGIKSWKQAMYYVSKYMAKPVALSPVAVPAPAGDCTGGEAAACSLVYVTYLTVNDKTPKQSIGRSWGIFNRKCLPLGSKKVTYLKTGDWLEPSKEMAKHFWPGINDNPGCGYSLFLDNPGEFTEAVYALQDAFTDEPGEGK